MSTFCLFISCVLQFVLVIYHNKPKYNFLDDYNEVLFRVLCATSGAGTTYPSGALEFIPSFMWVRVAHSLIFCVVFCRPLFDFLLFCFGRWIDCPSLNCGFWLPLWHFQTFLVLLLYYCLHCSSNLLATFWNTLTVIEICY